MNINPNDKVVNSTSVVSGFGKKIKKKQNRKYGILEFVQHVRKPCEKCR